MPMDHLIVERPAGHFKGPYLHVVLSVWLLAKAN